MLGAILRAVRGVEVGTDTLAAEVIAEVSCGEGHYLGHPQALARRAFAMPYAGGSFLSHARSSTAATV